MEQKNLRNIIQMDFLTLTFYGVYYKEILLMAFLPLADAIIIERKKKSSYGAIINSWWANGCQVLYLFISQAEVALWGGITPIEIDGFYLKCILGDLLTMPLGDMILVRFAQDLGSSMLTLRL